jgi:hypothetical protein
MGGNIFASLKVIDVSTLLKVERHKHAPSLPSMVFLEREVYELNILNSEFWYSEEYVENMFETKGTKGFYERKGEEYYNLYTDLLLGVQEWRRGGLLKYQYTAETKYIKDEKADTFDGKYDEDFVNMVKALDP